MSYRGHRGRALIIATGYYADAEFPPLPSCVLDAGGLQEVLADPQIGNFAVTTCLDPPGQQCRVEIEDFFSKAHSDDLLLLYLSGHGIKDEPGNLYFAATDTQKSRLRATGLPAKFIHEVVNSSRSRRIVIILDSCYSGAFASRGIKGGRPGDEPVGVADSFEGSMGLAVITASNSYQYAQAGEPLKPSLFTRFLIEGLRSGQADANGDGQITLDELYEHVLREIKAHTPSQRPQRWTFGLTGDLVLASCPARPDMPRHVTELMEHRLAELRLLAVEQLAVLLHEPQTTDKAAASEPARLAAQQALERLKEDPSREVSNAAVAVLERRRALAGAARAKRLAAVLPGTVFQEGEHCPEMVRVPPGTFQMGSPDKEAGRWDHEGPLHEVTIAYPLAVSRYPVTRGQWRHYLESLGRPGSGNASAINLASLEWEQKPEYDWLNPGFEQDDAHPVVCITWEEAQAYSQWLSHKTGQPYRLLTEAEYELVNRAGSCSAYFWGDSALDAYRYAKAADAALKARVPGWKWPVASHDSGYPFTAPVGSFLPNAFGLYDTSGNVWSWTADGWHDSYQGAPSDGSAWVSGSRSTRVVRGASWLNDASVLRCAYRGPYMMDRSGDSSVGLRVARTAG